MHTNLQNKTDPLIFIVQNMWIEQNQQILKWCNVKTQRSLKGKMLQLGAFAIMQLCFAPIFHSSPCSRWCSLLLTLEGGFVTEQVQVLVTEQVHWLPALTHTSAASVRFFCPETQDVPLCFPFICNWSYQIKGLLPKKPYSRESSRMLVI